MNYTKVRGHYSWWLKKEGKLIGQFNFNGLISDKEAEAYVDEIVKLEAERDALQAAKKACIDIYMDLHVSEMKGKPEHLKQAWSVGQEFYLKNIKEVFSDE